MMKTQMIHLMIVIVFFVVIMVVVKVILFNFILFIQSSIIKWDDLLQALLNFSENTIYRKCL
jgi:hypothetical protein